LPSADADIEEIAICLSREARMSEMVAKSSVLRILGGWDPFEIAVRTVLGQQISVTSAKLQQ
jgi:3-methyladenine DNA glycosylase/8-oxoguanine DNA glycosylase